jgi:5-formyltetrahydrofolate cyclo-ligase
MRAHLERLPAAERSAASALITTHLANWLSQRTEPGTIGLFAALPREPVLAGLPRLLPGWRFAYPRASAAGQMDFHLVTDPASQLRTGGFGILEPDPARSPLLDPSDLSIILCPGEAFTPAGHRLGKGGGFYDRFLARTPSSTLLVGIAFATQITPSLPVDPHDRHVSFLANEHGLTAVTGS